MGQGGGATPTVFPGAQSDEATPGSRDLGPVRLQAAYRVSQDERAARRSTISSSSGMGRWCARSAIDRVHGIWSCAKSFVSTVRRQMATVLPSR